jgi:hypothetical protein
MADQLASAQRAFAAHIRNPEHNPPPADVEARRMAIYRDLFFRNLSNFIARSFPVLRRLYSDTGWNSLIRHFFDQYRCSTPLFPEIPREFLNYLQEQRAGHPDDPAFALELAHYEWVETALDLDETDLAELQVQPGGDLLEGVPLLSPLAWPLAYNWPVHRIRRDFQPDTPPPEPTLLLVYRNRQDQVRFMQLNKVSMRLVQLLGENRQASGRSLLQTLASECAPADQAQFVQHGTGLLDDLRERDIILGSVP